ncbi:carbohydrate ABC transporter permease [Promicromonospora panici]|uniref:carbohydrate ABC transporter permease n=1 Tax=Promicromonospora panici TaxID=2219658 RepID=UPI001A91B0F9|nr:carbohydrate ABC transporter permease [Promicromonospora panici]
MSAKRIPAGAAPPARGIHRDHVTRRWLAIAGVVVTAVYLVPVYWMLVTSLKTGDSVFRVPPDLIPLPPTIEPYVHAVFGDADIARGLTNSAIIAVGTTFLTLALALPAAYGLAKFRLRGLGVVLMLMLVVQMVPSINLALPMFVLFSSMGLVNSYAGLIIANCALAVPLAVTILRPYFLTVPAEVIEAAKVDGCNELTSFARVALPISTPGVITVAVISFLGAWGEFVFALSLATSEHIQPITIVLAEFTNQVGIRWNDLMAVSAVVALPVIAAFVLLQRYIVAGLTDGATKT